AVPPPRTSPSQGAAPPPRTVPPQHAAPAGGAGRLPPADPLASAAGMAIARSEPASAPAAPTPVDKFGTDHAERPRQSAPPDSPAPTLTARAGTRPPASKAPATVPPPASIPPRQPDKSAVPAAPASAFYSEPPPGSGMEQVVTKMAWDQVAQAVAFSSGSALERLAGDESPIFFPGELAFAPDELLSAAAAQPLLDDLVGLSPTGAPAADGHTLGDVAPAPLDAPGMDAGISHSRAHPPGPSPLVTMVLCPMATLITLGGIGLLGYALTRPAAAADATDLARLDLRLESLTQCLLGAAILLGGLLLFIGAGLVHVAGAVKSRNA
ncbi:MAG TPA: hypothetical protein VFC78_07300, partial [Tepidisphaeraceae bacterium]|nr:hypothetical protein [Tepidisphaeraceae bacterium]